MNNYCVSISSCALRLMPVAGSIYEHLASSAWQKLIHTSYYTSLLASASSRTRELLMFEAKDQKNSRVSAKD